MKKAMKMLRSTKWPELPMLLVVVGDRYLETSGEVFVVVGFGMSVSNLLCIQASR